MRASERHLAAGCSVTRGGGEVVIDANVSKRMCLEELPVSVAEMQALSPEPLEFAMRHKHGNRLTPAGQFDFDTSFGLVDDPGQTRPGLRDGVPLGHIHVMYILMYIEASADANADPRLRAAEGVAQKLSFWLSIYQ